MKLGIIIQGGPSYEASDSAYNFIKAALEKGHAIQGIFFNNDGVFNVTNHISSHSDKYINERWSELGAKGIDIFTFRKDGNYNIVPNVRISGWGKLLEIAIESDRLITFDS